MSAYYTSVGSVNIRNVTMFLGIIRGEAQERISLLFIRYGKVYYEDISDDAIYDAFNKEIELTITAK